MHYFSTNRLSPSVSFREAVLGGQPPDKGLYFPSEINKLSTEFINGLGGIAIEDIAFEIMKPYAAGDIADSDLRRICAETVNFSLPLVELTERISTLELFHGPTLAFKDIGARFMSRCLQYFTRDSSEKTIVVAATSGDTGGAVAAGFHGIDGIEVVIIYPKGKVSRVQELQLTTLGGNVTTLELRGTFDDCQAIAKQALADPGLNARGRITSANSINVARWLPQQIYYFAAQRQWEGSPPVISVPSGNFGNLASGLLAHISGLPAQRFIAACNANDVVPRFIESGEYLPAASVSTLSNAMDVGAPSNFVRVLEIFGKSFVDLKEKMQAATVSDAATEDTMREVYSQCNYILDPHGAVGYRALADYIENRPDARGYFIETAHPVKFDSVADILGTQGPIPVSVRELLEKRKQSVEVPNDYASVRDILVSKL